MSDETPESLAILDGVKYRIGSVPAAMLDVDPRIQRPLDLDRVKKMEREYSPAALGIITVSKRRNGKMIVLDGQTRRALVQKLDPQHKMDAKIYTDLTIQQEALLFRLLNNTKRLTSLVLFRIAVIEKRPVETACNKLLKDHGLVAEGGRLNSFLAVVSLVRLFEADEKAATATIKFLCDAYFTGEKPVRDGFDSRMVSGVGRFVRKHGAQVDLSALARKLAKEGTPGAIIGEARTLAKMRKVTVADAIADKVVNVYNHGRSDDRGKLPVWGG